MRIFSQNVKILSHQLHKISKTTTVVYFNCIIKW